MTAVPQSTGTTSDTAEESGRTPRSGDRPGRLSAVAVWGLLVAMTTGVLVQIVRHGRNVPLAEDWLMVAPMLGEEPEFWSWVWEQNNEHRLPLARLVHLGLLNVSQDFRAGMFLNTLLMAAFAAALILVARRIRGRTSIVDAFFPAVVMHLGHWPNFVWSWQIQFVLVAALIGALLLMSVGAEIPLRLPSALLLGAILVALPLGGGTALAMVPVGCLTLLVFAWSPGTATNVRAVAVASCAVSIALVLLYFVGWERPWWYPPNPGPRPTITTSAKVLSMAWGPVARNAWWLFVLATLLLLASAVHPLVRGWRAGGLVRRRAIAVAAFLGGVVVSGVAIGYGRAALVPLEGLPDRYVIVTTPLLLSVWFAWLLFDPGRWARWLHAVLLAVAVLLIPLNTGLGFEWRDWYTTGMDAVEADIRAGASVDLIVERHGSFLLHWDAERLEDRILMLQRAGIGPFADLHSVDE